MAPVYTDPPRKNFNFRVIIPGVGNIQAQKVQLPEQEIEVVEHGGPNHNVGTPGKLQWSECVLEKLKPALTPDVVAIDWLKQAQDAVTGGGDPLTWQRTIQVLELRPDNVSTLNTHVLTVMPKKKGMTDLSRSEGAENQIETITMHVNFYKEF